MKKQTNETQLSNDEIISKIKNELEQLFNNTNPTLKSLFIHKASDLTVTNNDGSQVTTLCYNINERTEPHESDYDIITSIEPLIPLILTKHLKYIPTEIIYTSIFSNIEYGLTIMYTYSDTCMMFTIHNFTL